MALLSSLRKAFTVSYLTVASIPVLLFGLISIHLISGQLLEGVQNRNIELARNIGEEVDAFLLEASSDLHQVKQAIDSDIIQQDNDLNSFLSGFVSNSQIYQSIYYLDKNYRIINLGLLPKLEANRGDYLSLDYSGHKLFQQGLIETRPAWSNTFISLLTGEPTVTLGLPTRKGFLLGNLSLKSLDRFLNRYAMQGNVEIAIIDNNSTLIAHSIDDLSVQRINFGNHPSVVSAMGGTDTTREFHSSSRKLLESATQISTAGWVVWVGLDMQVVQQPIADMRDILVGFMVVTVILASVIALVNIRRLMLPLTALGTRANQIADGLYDFQYHPSGFKEIDSLAQQIRSMTKAIKVREESIITNEKRFRDLVNSIDGIVWEMSYPSFQFIFVSQQAETILGYPLQQWYKSATFWEDTIHPEDVASAKAYCQLMTERQEDHDFEYRVLGVDGRSVWIRDLVTVIVENGQVVRLIGVMIDITNQKELTKDLIRSEQNYREIFNASSDAIFVHDAESGDVLDVNESMLKMFNCTYEQAMQGGVATLSMGESPYSLDEAIIKIQEAKDKGFCTFEWRSRKWTGELFWTEVKLRSTLIGNEPRILAAVRDISERKEAAGQLFELNERLLLLIDRMPIGCIYWTPDFKVNLWNPAAEVIFGFDSESMIGRDPFGTIVADEVKSVVMEIWDRLVSGDATAHSVNENLTKDGSVITCEWINTPVLDSHGQTIGVISMVQDISVRKAAEAELEQYRTSLEELVKERTRQLESTQAELVQNERLAVLGQLTATVSHEIRNPLGTVANSLYLLREALSTEKQENLSRPLKLAERNVERCDNIISDLLDFSRQRTIEKAAIDINKWLVNVFDEIVIPDDVQLHLDLSADCDVPIDSERMRRVVVNIVTNAFQALEDVDREHKELQVSVRISDDRCELVFCDNGPGMSTDVMSLIYEPMFSTKNFGVGLGVPIIKNIITGHGGHVEYKSEAGQGTSVHISLPIV